MPMSRSRVSTWGVETGARPGVTPAEDVHPSGHPAVRSGLERTPASPPRTIGHSQGTRRIRQAPPHSARGTGWQSLRVGA